jgi:hypothetical protein
MVNKRGLILAISDRKLTAKLTDIQKGYWRFDAKEKANLVRSGPLNLRWPEMLRLNHLCCLETLQTKRGQRYLRDADAYGQDLQAGTVSDSYPGLDLEFWPEMLQKLVSDESPYRPRVCLVWQVKSAAANPRQPDLQGSFLNASITHLGSFEVIRADAEMKPRELDFIALDELAGLVLDRSAPFCSARLMYDDQREAEVVWIPLLYGISWMSPQAYDRDGSFTRFVGNKNIKIEGFNQSLGIGIGHQDLRIDNPHTDASMLFGLGSLAELSVALRVDDPKFEQKCRARGLTQEDVQRIIKGGS